MWGRLAWLMDALRSVCQSVRLASGLFICVSSLPNRHLRALYLHLVIEEKAKAASFSVFVPTPDLSSLSVVSPSAYQKGRITKDMGTECFSVVLD